MTIHWTGRRVGATAAGTPTLSGANVIDNPQTLDPTPESARALLYRHGLPEDVIDGALCLHAQELAAAIRNHPGAIPYRPQLDEDGGFWWDLRDRDAAADLIDPTRADNPAVLPAVPVPPTTHATDRADLRECIADAIREWHGDWSKTTFAEAADAVLAVLPETARLHDQILTLQAELATVRGLLRTENERANSAIDRETTAEEAEEEQRLALSQVLDLGTGAPWDAIRERAAGLRRMADGAQQQETRTPCSEPNACDPDGDLCDQHETERAHAEGEHAFCGVTCEAEFPTAMLRNGILAKGYPGTAGMLDELLRRARAGRQL